ncbi:MAG: TRAP transporter small permease subunit [Woeseia sp.]|nr:TRAP transporter small permease subunit [Woeseia sp.]MBT8097519.1 TRAP transporter small permease subunit [Woeseia sp.]NNE59603.1 TRAP transporter small permease subunit [Woeseia sp.]NNL55216.1 TRAP transporter small permease subunit [Woeseia sp.]
MSKESLSDRIDSFSRATGKATSWLTLLMVIVTVIIVVMRYAFDFGMIWLQESLTWMHAVVFMMGAAWTLQQDEHVRVDVFFRDMTERQKATVNLLGVLLFVFPLCGYIFFEAFDYVQRAWQIREISRDTGGLPYPAIPLLKSVLLLMPLALALQGLAMLLRSLQDLRGQ